MTIAYTLVLPLGSLVWRAHSAACTTMEEKGHTLVVSSAVVHASTLRCSDSGLDGSCGEAEGANGCVGAVEQEQRRMRDSQVVYVGEREKERMSVGRGHGHRGVDSARSRLT